MTPLAPKQGAASKFVELTHEITGLDFANELKPENTRKYLLNGAGLATGDFDNDGMVDLFAVSQDGANKLFRQIAPWRFKDVTESAGDLSGGQQWGTGASFADLNNDGWLDLYVCNINGPNQLFINQLDGTFVQEAEKQNAAFDGATTMASIADYDRDGDLDIYLVNNRLFSIAEEKPEIKLRQTSTGSEVHPDFIGEYFLLDGKICEAGQRDVLLQNDGSGHFMDVTDEASISGYDMGLSATWWDFDNDGWMDLYVANDLKSPDHLYRNLGNGKFEDVLPEVAGHTPWFSMGADAADINNDGRLDLMIADMSSTTHYKQKTTMGEMGNSAWFLTMGKPRQFMRNTLLVNSGGKRFYEAANLAGLDSTDWSWSIKFADFDSDSLVDVFVSNGVGRNMNDSDVGKQSEALIAQGKLKEAGELWNLTPPLLEENLAFRNKGDLSFENVSVTWGVNHLGVSQPATIADIDRDGDLDMIVGNMNERLSVYRNEVSTGNNLLVKLTGSSSNRNGIDARITIRTGDISQVRYITLARGYMSSDEPIAHFGLGSATQVDELTVQWPGGICQRFEHVEANNLVTITEGSVGKCDPPTAPKFQPWFTELEPKTSGLDFQHTELPIDDFSYQPLLPNKLSQLGPGIAWGDVNGDERPDCFVGNGSSMPAQLFIADANGTYHSQPRWFDEAKYEDMGAVFLDVDSDTDLDLYVASGGYEQPEGSDFLVDRIYLNDGKGNFTHAPAGTFPDIRQSSSCVSASDYDRDGDLDLFVGTRCALRKWPLATSSYLLENQNGKFVDVTDQRATGLLDIGLVTGNAWTDIDGDGWFDLVVSLEWGPVRCFRNDQGQFIDITDQSGLNPYRGWWNSVVSGDLDNDGDMDLVAMNAGLNTKYHCSPEKPAIVYVGDFDENGTLDIVETEWEGETCFPIRGKSCSSRAMPFLNEKFSTYHEFALADVAEIYTKETLDNSTQFSVSHLESMIFLNDGKGRFEAKPLPRIAQISPGFGVVIEDFNGDGNQDICVAQNFMNPQPETGQMDGGMGLLLAGNGLGDFQPLGPLESGICVSGQGMALTVADIDNDRAPDLVMAVNAEPLRSWTNSSIAGIRRTTIDLVGGPGNPTAVGSRVVVSLASGKQRTMEVKSGSGYLSQSVATLFVSESESDPVASVSVTWPDGTTQIESIAVDQFKIVIRQHQAVSR